ncbi:Hypothetical protein SMAX5B_018839 [Scophthalmus maximus]|uniref:Uncharacterized protein n=1 Tax=Scophthalmus maximus TaxID=52904 RepID=A0A2U9BUB3_SCOMX|nr:Hypothetical protein SMAX5B_018839 [Scophthalmus maximus]
MSCLISLRIPRDERASERQSVLVLSSCERTRKEEFPLVSSLRSQTCDFENFRKNQLASFRPPSQAPPPQHMHNAHRYLSLSLTASKEEDTSSWLIHKPELED